MQLSTKHFSYVSIIYISMMKPTKYLSLVPEIFLINGSAIIELEPMSVNLISFFIISS